MSWISLIVGIVGGTGLFLVGLRTAIDGIRVAGGTLLRNNLWRWTCNRKRSLATGAVSGMLLPATGVLTETGLGLAGLVGSRQALWILIGSSLGAVLAGTAVVVLGSPFALQFVALVVLTAGVIAQRVERSPWTAWGTGAVGLGIVGLGLSVLAATLGAWGAASTYPGLDVGLPLRTLLCATFGGLLAAGLRSAALATAIVLLACGAGLLHTVSGFGWLLGIPLGLAALTIPAVRTRRGHAQRILIAHLVHLGVTAIVGVALLACSLPLVVDAPGPLADPMLFGALFIVSLRVIAAGVMATVDGPLLRLLDERVPETEEEIAYGGGLLEVPELARDRLVGSLQSLAARARDLARAVLSEQRVTDFRARDDCAALNAGATAIGQECALLIEGAPPRDLARAATEIAHAARLQARLGEESSALRLSPAEEAILGAPLRSRLRQVQLAVVHLIEGSDPFHRRFAPRELGAQLETIGKQMRDLRLRLLQLGTQGTLPAETLEALLERTTRVRGLGTIALEAGGALARALPHPPSGVDTSAAETVEEAHVVEMEEPNPHLVETSFAVDPATIDEPPAPFASMSGVHTPLETPVRAPSPAPFVDPAEQF